MIDVARIQAWAYRCPTPTPVATSFGIMHDRPAVLVRLEDRDGAFGWGEVWANWPAAGAEHRVRLLEMDIAQLIIGKTFKSQSDAFHFLECETRIRAVQCGEIGPFAQVIAGLDIALWDMAARKAGVPLRKYIRADAPDNVPAYASGIQISAAEDLVPAARAAGHQRFKLKVGFDMDRDISSVEGIQSGLQGNEFIACDANQAWTLDQAIIFAKAIENLPIHWLEEPLPVFSDAEQWRELAQKSRTPLAGGENIIGAEPFEGAIGAGYLSIIQPDVAKWGGITGCLGVAKSAMGAGRRYFPHFLGAGVGLAASAELLAAAGGDGVLEVDINANPLRSRFFEGGQEPVSNGMWTCAQAVGLGFVPNPEELAEFATLETSCR